MMPPIRRSTIRMTFLLAIAFVAYSIFSAWVVFWDGAEVLEGWKASALMDWTAGMLTAQELRISVCVSWLVAVVLLIVTIFPL
jgi:hypothetical protein